MTKKLFDPNKSFLDLRIVRWTAGITFTLSALVAITIKLTSDLTTDFTHAGFNFAATAFKFPLGMMATLIPVIALMAANHRSEQTKEQMRLASENNNFTNYFKHLSEFESYTEKHKIKKDIKFKSVRNLHKIIFPNSKNGIYKASPEIPKQIEETIKQAIEITERIIATQNQVHEIELKYSETRKPFMEIEKAIRANIKEIEKTIEKTKTTHSISDLTKAIETNTKKDEAHKNIASELEKLSAIEIDIDKIEENLKTETKPLLSEIENENKKLREISKTTINKAKIIKEIKIIKTTNETEEREFELLKEESNAAETIGTLATAINAINTSLQFDEDYETSKRIELFTNLFGDIEQKTSNQHKENISKYIEQIEKS